MLTSKCFEVIFKVWHWKRYDVCENESKSSRYKHFAPLLTIDLICVFYLQLCLIIK